MSGWTRRQAMAHLAGGLGALWAQGCALSLEDGLMSPCRRATPPKALTSPLVRAAFEDIDVAAIWDAHVHLLGTGDGDSGAWVNPDRQQWTDPVSKLQGMFYKNAACAELDGHIDAMFVHRLRAMMDELPTGFRLMLFAFDQAWDEQGQPMPDLTTFYVPDVYAWRIARTWPARFEWVASIHPWRTDALEALELAASRGARAIKWLPASMNIDPSSERCDAFYDALARLGLPLITHAGTERALVADEEKDLANPLRLRRALDRGVRVVMAHCASLGQCPDLDAAPDAPPVDCFDLFARMMDEPRYDGLLFGEISGLTQNNRLGKPLRTTMERTDWHPRLVWGSDYPLAGVVPLTSLGGLAGEGFITDNDAELLHELRVANPVLFDFVLKRTLRLGELAYPAQVFESRRVFGDQPRSDAAPA